MSREGSGQPETYAAFEKRAREAEQRCETYRRAFLLMLNEPFADLDRTIVSMLEVLSTTLGVERVGFWAFNAAGDAIECRHQFVRHAPAPQALTRITSRDYPDYFRAVSRHLVIAADDVGTDPRTCELAGSYLQPLGIVAMLDVPVRAFGRCIGVLCHEHTGAPRRWLAEDQHFASGVATQVALAHERDRIQRAQQDIIERGLHDDESQLPNRLKLDGDLDAALAKCLAGRSPGGALVVATVDQYHHVSAALGTARMLHLVRQFAARLAAAAAHTGGLAARIAPNEFALLIPGVVAEDLAVAVSRAVAPLAAPLESNGRRVFITLSTGYTGFGTEPAASAGQLRTEARLAAQAAKEQGGDRVLPFTVAMREAMLVRIRMEQDLRRALEEKEFALEFQPIVALDTGTCSSVEALLRWRHPERGLLRPEEFIAVAIEAGIMTDLGRRVLRAACQGLKDLRARTGVMELGVTVNMSVPEVLLPGTAEVIRQELESTGLAPAALTIEVTESVLIADIARARAAIEELRAVGVRISLDDFGTLHSSLSWLRGLPVDSIKIDRSFVAGIDHDRRDVAIVQSILGLAVAFDQTVVAEGIETSNQLRKLRELGLRFGQGELFGAPRELASFSRDSLREAGERARAH